MYTKNIHTAKSIILQCGIRQKTLELSENQHFEKEPSAALLDRLDLFAVCQYQKAPATVNSQ